MALIFTLERQYATLSKETGIDLTFEHSVSRADFLAQFGAGVDFSTTRQLSYEPSRPLYHIMEQDYSVVNLESDPTTDPRMNAIHSNIAAIETWYDAQYAASQPSGD